MREKSRWGGGEYMDRGYWSNSISTTFLELHLPNHLEWKRLISVGSRRLSLFLEHFIPWFLSFLSLKKRKPRNPLNTIISINNAYVWFIIAKKEWTYPRSHQRLSLTWQGHLLSIFYLWNNLMKKLFIWKNKQTWLNWTLMEDRDLSGMVLWRYKFKMEMVLRITMESLSKLSYLHPVDKILHERFHAGEGESRYDRKR